jgi:acyl carrier protein
VSINWDGWREVGMAAGLAWPDGVGIATDRGMAAFDRILAGPAVPQVLVSTMPLEQRLGGASQDLLMTLAQSASRPAKAMASGASQPRPVLATPFEAPVEELDIHLAGIWQELLGIEPVGLNDNFFELGGDSLLAIQVLARVKAAFGVAVQTAVFFQDPTVAGLAMRVETCLIDDIENA